MALVKTLIPGSIFLAECCHAQLRSFAVPSSPYSRRQFKASATKMASTEAQGRGKTIDSHLHVWASPQEAADKYPYFPGQESTLPGHLDFLFQCMEEASVDGALIVQPINHKFDHSLVTSVLKKHPTKFVGCCLANPAENGTGVKQLEDLILKMTNEVGKAMFSRAGELGVPVGFMCMKGLNLHISEITELCTEFPSTAVLLDHMAFCRPPTNDEEKLAFSELLKLSRFHQVYVKFSALFRVSRMSPPYEDLVPLLAEVVSNFGANRVMWGSDFPFVVPESGYKGGKEAASHIASRASLSSSEVEWIMGKTVMQLFQGQWLP
ncbi:4-sulfomuconolactone hydrolase-like isoform X2 [Hibiscus syriacus]|uniref:4-sulfomuconolactone hydrolase-like isoform X2 n=1 Tax=Hibiscus syriacus TaxID=106335 RepID=UPI001920FD85|nr:4-sulfomuconolactone hydrolase-like isoform X2 [Hibiscus syriacus]